MVRSFTNRGWSAATQVKVVSPEILLVARGQGVVCPEASIATDAIRRVRRGVPGSQTAAGHPTDRIGTWEGRIACLPREAEKARTGRGDTAIGPTHSRGVAGVTPGAGPDVSRRVRVPLEGVGSRSNRAEDVRSIH